MKQRTSNRTSIVRLRQLPLQSNSYIRFSKSGSGFFCLLALALLFSGCGKRRPPQPPVERVPQRTEGLTGSQQGNQIVLAWPAPQRNAPDGSVQSIRRVDVYRLAERVDAPLPLTEEEFGARSTLIGSVDYDAIRSGGDTLTYRDALQFGGEASRLRYAIRYVNAEGQRASFSNFLLIEPTARVALPPNALTAQEREDGIALSWQPPAQNIEGSTPVNLLGYNVYRISPGETKDKAIKINSDPVTDTSYLDKSVTFDAPTQYFVRSVSLGTGGQPVESLNSNGVSVTPRNRYPPSAPTSITIAAAPGRLSLFFPANPELDVAGYNIYRSEDQNLPFERWTKLNVELITRTTFQDDKVESGKKYYYYLTAVDKNGNVSPRSEVVSETVP